ncbi:MAG: sigma-70 family RNA polymerase sigma factor [bacterium]
MNDEIELWIEYKERYNLEARDALIEKYLNYSYAIGIRIYRKYSDFLKMDKEEIFGITSFALIKAIETYDYTKKIPFNKYLSKVMNWYVKQELSKYMNISIRDQMKIFKKLSNNKNSDILKIVISLSYRNMGSIEGHYRNSKDSSLKDIREVKEYKHGFEEVIENNEILAMINSAIENLLNDNEKNVLKKMYYDNKKLGVVSSEMGLSKQRVNQIHKSALEKIRNFIKKKIYH